MKKLATILVVVGVVNFLGFSVISLNLGGGAHNGEIRDGRYFLAEHGCKTEVSERVYRRMMIHERSVWITLPLSMFGVLILGSLSGWKRPK